jgi:undecaprenyldiphospho-muramoylpentapeptide beta-N-acetylglucosaminyltransferase
VRHLAERGQVRRISARQNQDGQQQDGQNQDDPTVARVTARTPGTWAIFAGGGTAGHLHPGLAVAAELVARGHDPATIHFVGGDTGVERRLVPAAGFTVDELPGRGIERRLSVSSVKAALGLVQAALLAFGIVRRLRPRVVVVLGGYAAAACGLAAVLWRVPVVVLEQNVLAGAANKVLGRFAAASVVSFQGTDLPRAVVTGNPLRGDLVAAADAAGPESSRQARATLGLPDDRTVVAVFTGSLGSRRVNDAVRGLVDKWGDRSDLAIRHVTGKRDYENFVTGAHAPPAGGLVYQVVAYEERMDLLLASADLAVTRAGGGVAELAALGVPAILVPLPIATRDHQTANAKALVAAGAAVMVPDGEFTTERLIAELGALLDDRPRLDAMAAAMRRAAHLDAAERVADVVEKVAS